MRYRAFFSYARADDRVANWLHRQLDGYRTPKALVDAEGELGPVPAKLHPIFRDRTDLESGGHVDAALQQALEDSEILIVLCTPTSAKSHWVNHEVETFLKLGREGAIFPVIAAGVPDSSDPDTECFPPALRGKGLLAADLREIKLPSGQLVGDGREGGRLKLIAGLLGVKLDALVQRERRRQRQTVAVLSAAALSFLAIAVFAGVQMLAANRNAAKISWRRSAEAIQAQDYPQAFATIMDAVTLQPLEKDAFLPQLRWINFLTAGEIFLHSSQSTIVDASMSADANLVASVNEDGVLQVSNRATGKNWAAAGLPLATVAVGGSKVIALGADAPRSETVTVWVWSEGGGDPKRFAIAGFSQGGVALAPDGKNFVVCDAYHAGAFSTETGAPLWVSEELGFQGDGHEFYDCIYNESGDKIASVHSGSWALFEASTGQMLMTKFSNTGSDVVGPYADMIPPDESSGVMAPALVADRFQVCEPAEGVGAETPKDRLARFFSIPVGGDRRLREGEATWSERTGNANRAEQTLRSIRREGGNVVVGPMPSEARARCGVLVETVESPEAEPEQTDASPAQAPPTPLEHLFLAPGFNSVAISPNRSHGVVGDAQGGTGATRLAAYDIRKGKAGRRFGNGAGNTLVTINDDGRLIFVLNARRLEVWDGLRGELIDQTSAWNCASYCAPFGPYDSAKNTFLIGEDGNGGAETYAYPAPEFVANFDATVQTLCVRLFSRTVLQRRPRACGETRVR